jgi:hypothetical protein
MIGHKIIERRVDRPIEHELGADEILLVGQFPRQRIGIE